MFYKCFSEAVWDRFKVTAPGDCNSSIKPKMVFRPTVLPAISFILGRTGGGHRRRPSFSTSRRRPSAHTEMFFFHIFNSVHRPFLSWHGVDCQRGWVFFSFSGEPGRASQFAMRLFPRPVQQWLQLRWQFRLYAYFWEFGVSNFQLRLLIRRTVSKSHLLQFRERLHLLSASREFLYVLL